MAVTIGTPYGDNEALITPWRARLQEITLDNSYPTGGYTIAPGDAGLSNIIGAAVIGVPSGVGYWFLWNSTTGKLQAFEGSTGAASGDAVEFVEVANATDLSAVKVNLLFLGI